MAVTFETSQFEFAHARKPRGWGVWAFDMTDVHGQTRTVFTPTAMSFAEAKAWCRREWVNRDTRRVQVAS